MIKKRIILVLTLSLINIKEVNAKENTLKDVIMVIKEGESYKYDGNKENLTEEDLKNVVYDENSHYTLEKNGLEISGWNYKIEDESSTFILVLSIFKIDINNLKLEMKPNEEQVENKKEENTNITTEIKNKVETTSINRNIRFHNKYWSFSINKYGMFIYF